MTNVSVPDVSEAEERRAAADPLIGLVVADRYRILSVLGVGGMGVVYKVEHIHIGKLMAMKLLSGALSRDPVVIKRFKREALAASRLSHPNTVQVFDYGEDDHLTYLVMELVAGEDLARVLRADGPLPVARVARLMVQVCGSLAEAHAAGIVHRDLKPENVMLVRSRDGKEELPKVCDFGVAKLRGGPEGSNDATQDKAVVGTPYYMSPEQIRGDEDVDARADIYALGAMMYRLVTGRPPFEGQSPLVVFAKHLTETPVPPSERAPDAGIPRTVDTIVLRAMARDRNARYASVEALQNDLFDMLRAGTTSSVDLLVDQGHLALVASNLSLGSSPSNPALLSRKTATRDEVAAYERKLAWQRRFGQGLLTAALLGGAVGLALVARKARGYVEAQSSPPALAEGSEHEPNDDAATANPEVFGREVRGQIGKRLGADRSDRDFYAFDVPAGVSRAQIKLTALPNFAVCLWFYRSGTTDPLARFCPGAPRQNLTIPSYQVEPGRYLLAVLQDTDGHGGDSPPVHENVSDFYTLTFGPAAGGDEVESEPNDTPMSARRVSPGVDVRGTLNFSNDEDVLCPPAGFAGPVRWQLRDAFALGRPSGTALEATLARGSLKDSLRVVVHRPGSLAPGKPDGVQVVSPYSTPPLKLDGAPTTGCLRLRLARDPWAQGPGVREPLPSDEMYVVRLDGA